jgi:hypothetical protein
VKNNWGSNQFLIWTSFRYCLGRMSTIVSTCVDFLKANWKDIDKVHRDRIIEEIKEAIERGRAGMDCDVDLWKSLIEFSER